MKINFTKKQMQHLIRLGEAGSWLINSHRDDEIKEYEEINQYILESAYKMGLEEVIYDKGLAKYFLTPGVEEEMTDLAQEYDDYTFFEELPTHLAKRDYAREENTRNNDQESYLSRIFELEEKYVEEFMENGLENLEIKKK